MFEFLQGFIHGREDKEIANKYLAEGIERTLAIIKSDARAVVDLVPNGTDRKGEPILNKLLTLEMAFSEAYMLNSVVAECVNLICDSFSSVPFVLEERKPDGTVEILKHKASDLLNDPNDYQDGITFRKVLMQRMLLCGNALLWPNSSSLEEVRKVTGIKGLELFDPDDFDVVSVDRRRIDKYVVKEKVWKEFPKRYPKREFKASELIHFIDNPDPTNPYWGLGRIQSCYRSIDISSKIQSWWIDTMKNGCRKDAILKFKKDLGDVQFKRIKRQVETQLNGMRNGGGVMIIGREHEVEFINQSPKDMDFSQAEKDTAKRVIGIFRVPAPLLNEGETSEYNQAPEARKTFWIDNILMLCSLVASVMNKFYLPLFPDLKGRDVYLTYDFSQVDALVRQYSDLIKDAFKLFEMGFTRDAINKKLGMGWEPDEDSDEGYLSVNLVSRRERAARLKLDQEAHKLEQQKADDQAKVALMSAKSQAKAATQKANLAPYTGAKSKTGQSPANKYRGNQKK